MQIKVEKVHNPLADYEGYNCFGCCKKNEKGLHLDFYRYGDALYSVWEPDMDLQGYFNLLHGGIQATLADEVGAWWIYAIGGVAGLTSRLEIKYLRSVSMVEGKIYIEAREYSRRRNIYTLCVRILNAKLEECATALIDYYTFSAERSVKEMYYPGLDAYKGETAHPRDFGLPESLFGTVA
jgi:uncharacterized protein (TIGR00369 family)